jgi:four helix bundle protein
VSRVVSSWLATLVLPPKHCGPHQSLKEITMKVKNYQELIVWQKAMDLVEEVYIASKSFPREEIYGLTSQLRRAAISIPSNVAEGQGRRTTPDFLRHLSIAYGSLREVETQILIATRLRYLAQGRCQDVMKITGEVGRLMNGLMASLAS